jgi:DNA (cytosine-5)-methyltransferase 1
MSLKPAIFSFFSGLGFLDLGFEKSGYEIVYVNEIYDRFLKGYKYARNQLDIREPKYGYVHENIIDLFTGGEFYKLKSNIKEEKNHNRLIGFIGGPPCPDFSVGGKNKGRNGENGKLSGFYIDLVNKLEPDFFLFENVKGLWQTKIHRVFYENLKKRLMHKYLLTDRLINTIEYGVPQDRDRIILIGFKKDFIRENCAKNEKEWDDLFPWKKDISYEKDKVFDYKWATCELFEKNSAKPFPNSVPKELTVQYWFEKNDVKNHPNSNHHFTPRAAKSKFEVIKEGDDSRKSFKRLHRWRYSPTAAYGHNEVHLHPYKVRRLSAAESLAIQSLPKEFELPDELTLTDMFKGIGNGVPFLASKGLAKTIKYFLETICN